MLAAGNQMVETTRMNNGGEQSPPLSDAAKAIESKIKELESGQWAASQTYLCKLCNSNDCGHIAKFREFIDNESRNWTDSGNQPE